MPISEKEFISDRNYSSRKFLILLKWYLRLGGLKIDSPTIPDAVLPALHSRNGKQFKKTTRFNFTFKLAQNKYWQVGVNGLSKSGRGGELKGSYSNSEEVRLG